MDMCNLGNRYVVRLQQRRFSLPETPQPGSGAIELTVSAGDFVTDGAPDTRAADNGDATTFENGDRIGLIIVADNGATWQPITCLYTYDGANWAFDSSVASSANTGKTAAYYDNGIENVTYIAYFHLQQGC